MRYPLLETGSNILSDSVIKSKHKLSSTLKDESFDVDQIGNYCLHLNISSDAFHLAVTDNSSNKCLLLEEYVFERVNNDDDLVNELKSIWENHHVLKAGFWKKIRTCYTNQLFTFIPSSLFDKSKLSQFLSLTTTFSEEEHHSAAYKHLSSDAINVFGFSKKVEEFLTKTYPKVKLETTHGTSALIEGVLRDAKFAEGKHVVLSVEHQHIDLVVVENKKLIFCNRFQFTSAEDFIYYIMLVYNELELNPEEVALNIYGEIAPNSPLYDAIQKYIRFSNFGKRPQFLKFSYHFDEVFDHKYFNTYAIHLCE